MTDCRPSPDKRDGGRETVHKFFEISKISTITKEFKWPIAVQGTKLGPPR